MTVEASTYETAMTGEGARAMATLEDSPWLPMYQEAAGYAGPGPLVDLGCGTGRFAVALAKAGHTGGYTGIDFAPGNIAEAGAYIAWAAPEYAVTAMLVADLREWEPDEIRAGSTQYVCLEVLEHLDDDLDLIRRIPGGHRFVFSVPNYGSASHVRRFPSPASVWERYEGLLEFRRWSLVRFSDTHTVHVLDTVRRLDSWT